MLPLFNSNAIISRLHHIAGLGRALPLPQRRHVLRPRRRARRLLPPQRGRPALPGQAAPAVRPGRRADEPHVNLSRNIRTLLEDRFGVTITRAVRHTPYPQLRSRQRELEALFPEAYADVLRHPFRHHDDVAADQLLHYYLQVVGAGVPSAITYDYVNIGVAEEKHRLRRLLLEPRTGRSSA